MSEIEANEVQTDVPADVIDPVKVIYEGECLSISGRSTLSYAVGRHADDKTLHLAITGNSVLCIRMKGRWGLRADSIVNFPAAAVSLCC